MSCAISDQQYHLAQATIQKIKALKVNDADSASEQCQNICYGQQMLYLNTGDFQKAHALIPQIKQALDIHSEQINPSRKYSLGYNCLITCFILSKYDEAHQWLIELQHIRHLKKYEPRKDVQQFLQILQY